LQEFVWSERAINDSYIRDFSDQSDKASHFGEETMRKADPIYRLSQPRAWEHVPEFDTKLVEILRGAGVSVSKVTLPSRLLRRSFQTAWHQCPPR
jgi:hypothetical protein